MSKTHTFWDSRIGEIRPLILWGLGGRFFEAFWNSGLQHPVDGRPADPVALCELAQAVTLLPTTQDGGAVQHQRLASDVLAFEAGAAHPGPHPLDDQVALELRDRSDDDHDGAAQRAASVDLFAEADELHV